MPLNLPTSARARGGEGGGGGSGIPSCFTSSFTSNAKEEHLEIDDICASTHLNVDHVLQLVCTKRPLAIHACRALDLDTFFKPSFHLSLDHTQALVKNSWNTLAYSQANIPMVLAMQLRTGLCLPMLSPQGLRNIIDSSQPISKDEHDLRLVSARKIKKACPA